MMMIRSFTGAVTDISWGSGGRNFCAVEGGVMKNFWNGPLYLLYIDKCILVTENEGRIQPGIEVKQLVTNI